MTLKLHDAGDEVEDVAVVVGGRIHDVDNVEAADGFLRGHLRGINDGRGFVNLDGLTNFLLVRDGDFNSGVGINLDGLGELVEAFFFDAQEISSGWK